ncbi:transposable element Tcb1 transposase [Trichonephila clavipes]|nr:transposable element Tcb1 transposase [Trichonephila clavipes]
MGSRMFRKDFISISLTIYGSLIERIKKEIPTDSIIPLLLNSNAFFIRDGEPLTCVSLVAKYFGHASDQKGLLKLHWCAKIKDEVQKLANQLNEKAERKERPIRRLSRIIGKLEEGRSVTSVAAEFGIAHSIVSRLWRQFQTTGTAIRGFSSGRPRATTPAVDRYIVLQAKRNRRQTAGEIARHTTQATGRPISRFTVARRLHGGGLFARRPVRCLTLTPALRRRRSLWCREHRNWRDNERGRVLFTDESRFSLSSDSHRILIWRERGSRNHPSNIIERVRYGGRGVLV